MKDKIAVIVCLGILNFATVGCGGGDTAPNPTPGPCITDTTQACSCTDGASGAQTCSEGQWGQCTCTGQPLCADGDTQACACPGGGQGEQACSGEAWGSCEGCSAQASCWEFSTGSTFNTGEDFYEACDTFPPTNCTNGTFIWFEGNTSQCYCALTCDAFDPVRQPGQACDSNGEFTCTYLENEGGTSTGNWCLPQNWIQLDLDCSE